MTRINRIYTPSLEVPFKQGDTVDILDGEAHHALRVLRMQIGQPVQLFNGQGLVAESIITEIEPRKPRLQVIINDICTDPRPKHTFVVATAIPKGPRADSMVDQLSQLGVTTWQPLMTEYSATTTRPKKIDKWRRIAIESAKQSGRSWLMRIPEPILLTNLLQQLQDQPLNTAIVAHPDGETVDSVRLNTILQTHETTLLIGPEGGFSSDEIHAAQNASAIPLRFSPHIMRIETAAVAISAILSFCNNTETS